jgi:hypothetical protein
MPKPTTTPAVDIGEAAREQLELLIAFRKEHPTTCFCEECERYRRVLLILTGELFSEPKVLALGAGKV